MHKSAAYAAGAAQALKDAGLVKLAVNDDTSVSATAANSSSPADGLADFFNMQKKFKIPKPMPDNITKRTKSDPGVSWGKKMNGASADRLSNYGLSNSSQ